MSPVLSRNAILALSLMSAFAFAAHAQADEANAISVHEPGQRVVTLPVTDEATFGALSAGDRADIFFVSETAWALGPSGREAMILLSDVEIAFVELHRGAGFATLQISARDSEKLMAAAQLGDLSLELRGSFETDPGIDQDSLSKLARLAASRPKGSEARSS